MDEIEKLQYDKKADVLYLYFKDPEKIESMISEEVKEGVLLDREEKTDKIVGCTITNFRQWQEENEGFEVISQEILTA
ncbi:MAG: DUF2283 domain-containing protein [Candidatus Nanohaloarchaea archaeon]|nr:DUF2283 domain-containing protein [Candidatus Nanohaloarchaea archaeon]